MNGDYIMSRTGKSAVKVIEGQGFSLPPKPEETVELPPDVSEVDAPELMALFSIFTAWADYASAQVGLAAIQEREKERSLEVVEARVWQSIPPKTTVAGSKALLALDGAVLVARTELDSAHAYRRLVTDLAARYERDAAVLSRELTRRTAESGPRSSRRERWST